MPNDTQDYILYVVSVQTVTDCSAMTLASFNWNLAQKLWHCFQSYVHLWSAFLSLSDICLQGQEIKRRRITDEFSAVTVDQIIS